MTGKVKSKTSLDAILTFSVALIFVVIRVALDSMSTEDIVEPMDVSINLKNPSNIKNGGRTRLGAFTEDIFTMFLFFFFILQTVGIRCANNISRGDHFMSLYFYLGFQFILEMKWIISTWMHVL